MSDLSASLLSMAPFDGPAPWTSPLKRTDWLSVAATRSAAPGPSENDDDDTDAPTRGDSAASAGTTEDQP
ncbi:hypothetical protein [Cryobacterium psychrophilum]|uniref:Uncharacterized protein n=1 Tax=Cryobacterium psychrophilum TaxID=41988 RepID=A0A4Y8KQF5_9MICO|nr:hypothetical protein [Cryobacterium psychrophilum]TDW28968.1 hypothetical protein EDD25_0640 [Cryobacterium psychrophilum]TFD81246.1 hypothetical protein E3T53_03335 [Cryobacterium psychrophilum]